MAYVSKERKAAVLADLQKVIPTGFKWSLAVSHGSTLVLTIRSGPLDLIGTCARPAP